jgi:hypothetical protein
MKKRKLKVHRKNNFGEGFAYGAVLALVSFLYYNRLIPLLPVYLFIQVLILVFYGLCTLIVIGLGYYSSKSQKSFFGTWGNGFFTGASSVFDSLIIVVQFAHHENPFSLGFIYLTNL